jgi:urease accessory protein
MDYVNVPRIGVGGPVGSGKTALIERIVPRLLKEGLKIGIVTNDILTKEDADRLKDYFKEMIPEDLIIGVETGACPHTVIREDPSMNVAAIDELLARSPELDLVILESGGDNLAATYSTELVDYFIYIIDVSEGDDIPRKSGPGITQCDLLVINKVDLAPYVDADLEIMKKDSERVRGGRPFIFTNCKTDQGVDDVIQLIKHNLFFK